MGMTAHAQTWGEPNAAMLQTEKWAGLMISESAAYLRTRLVLTADVGWLGPASQRPPTPAVFVGYSSPFYILNNISEDQRTGWVRVRTPHRRSPCSTCPNSAHSASPCFA